MPRVICPNCSNAYTPPSMGAERCPRCGYGVGSEAAPPTWAPSGAATFTPTLSPPGPTLAPPAPVQRPGSNGFAVASMVLGIVAIIPIPGLGGVLAILAVIFGIVALRQVKKRNQPGQGMAITGIVLGSIVLLLYFVIFSFFAALF